MRSRNGSIVTIVWGLAVAAILAVPIARASDPLIPNQPNVPSASAPSNLRQAWDAFRARYGEDWTVEWDFAARAPARLYGPGIDMTDQPLDAALVDGLARSFLDENSGLVRLDGLEIRGAASLHGSTWYLNYGFTRQGVPIDEASRIDFRFKPNGVLAMFATYHLPRTFEQPLEADIPADAAIRLAEATLPTAGGPYVVRAEPLLQIRVNKAAVGQLAWRFELRNNRGDLPIARDFSVHAIGDGEILESRNRIFEVDVTGNVQANTHNGDPATPVVPHNLARVGVSIVGGASTFTDAGGNFTIPNAGTAPVTVRVGTTTTAYSGSFAMTANQAGANDLFTTSATPGTPLNVVLNGTPSELTNAQADGYLQTTIGHDYVSGIIGETFGLGRSFQVNVNLAQTCNAFYDGTSTNFYRAGGGCNNTAYDSVCRHEYGHAVDDGIQGITDGALSEGVADTISMFSLNDGIVGRNFFTNGNIIRDGNNTRQWPASECSGEVHCVGEVFMGFTWQARQQLIAALGAGVGTARAEQVVLNALFGNGPDIPNQVADIYVQDDDDGNLNNGVPDQMQLDAAADAHNLPHPSPVFITITHTALPATTTNSSVPYTVVATISSTAGSITSASLLYSSNNGPFQTVAMSPNGNPNGFSGAIPAQPCGTAVAYYISANDSGGHVATLPRGAPGSSFHFDVGIRNRIVFDDFEAAGDGGWTHGLNGTGQDDWQHGAPNQQGTNALDPSVAFSGTSVWGNDLNPPGFNGNYRDNTSNFLTSPTFNMTGQAGLHLVYARWLTVEDGFYDHARIKVNGTVVWENPPGPPPHSTHLLDTSWVLHDVNISALADNQPSVVVQYTLDSDGGLNFGGWNIDDFSIVSASNNPSISVSSSNNNPAIGSPVTFTFTGTPSQQVFLVVSNQTGTDSFQVPNGPLVPTLLRAPRQRLTTNLNSAGTVMITRNAPNNPALHNRTFFYQAIINACSGLASTRGQLTIQ
ncbi:MAG: hypothetical protein HYR85_04470 [Planctomycetes bacterium]|nr:hypothetical protein [Planctomycetota bacterium]MBI3844092.1 hypothetical protein [Planctomycetota bacterium]